MKTFLSGLAFVLIIYIIKGSLVLNVWAEMIISISLASIVYIFLIYVLKVVDIKEIKKLVKRVI